MIWSFREIRNRTNIPPMDWKRNTSFHGKIQRYYPHFFGIAVSVSIAHIHPKLFDI
jgi:hypothetical protein